MNELSIIENIIGIYRCIKLLGYKDMFCGIKEKAGSLSATEAFSADIINIMGEPTVTEFAEYIGISQPNATYKVNCLVAKGYLEKTVNSSDRREIHLKTSEKFSGYYKEDMKPIEQAIDTLKEKYTEHELEIAEKVLSELFVQINSKINIKGEK